MRHFWFREETGDVSTFCCRTRPIANPAVTAIERFASSTELAGRIESRDAIDAYNTECGGIIPDWHCDVLSRVPLCGVELEWPHPNHDGEFVGVEWMDVANMRSEMLDCYPGMAIRPNGYVCIAGCALGSGDQYYICNADGDDPPVYQIYHDVSDVADEIISSGREIIFPKLSQLFEIARIA